MLIKPQSYNTVQTFFLLLINLAYASNCTSLFKKNLIKKILERPALSVSQILSCKVLQQIIFYLDLVWKTYHVLFSFLMLYFNNKDLIIF